MCREGVFPLMVTVQRLRDSRRHVAKNQCPPLGGACRVDACELLTFIRTHPAFPLYGLSADPTDATFPGFRCVAGVACALLIFCRQVVELWCCGEESRYLLSTRLALFRWPGDLASSVVALRRLCRCGRRCLLPQPHAASHPPTCPTPTIPTPALLLDGC